MPAEIADVAGLPRLVEALRERYDEDTLHKLGTGNWLRVLDATWHA
jgi:membrane dipeptidase